MDQDFEQRLLFAAEKGIMIGLFMPQSGPKPSQWQVNVFAWDAKLQRCIFLGWGRGRTPSLALDAAEEDVRSERSHDGSVLARVRAASVAGSTKVDVSLEDMGL